jgi:hypothetical protein
MNKLAAVAFTAVLGVSGIACATSANANPYVGAEVVVPRIAVPRVVVEPFAFAPGIYSPYYARAPYAWRRDYGRWAYGWNRRFYRR